MKSSNLFLFLFLIFCKLTMFGQSNSNNLESEIILKTATGDISGTLTLPSNKKKLPIAIIISGSGPTDRNGNNNFASNNSLKFIAHLLAEKNIASVRFDKRGIGKSQDAAKEESEMRFENNFADVEAWIDLVRNDGRFGKITIIGHSEGSLIGMVAAKKADAFISLAGAGRTADDVLKEQLQNIPPAMQKDAFVVLDSLKMGFTVNNYDKRLFSLFRPSVQPYLISWMKYDPAVEISKLKIPVLIVQGAKDLQVSVEDSKKLLNGKKDSKYLLIENMNHVLKTIKGERKENFDSYNDPKMPLDIELSKGILNFIKKYAK